jgi:hypothetical protein
MLRNTITDTQYTWNRNSIVRTMHYGDYHTRLVIKPHKIDAWTAELFIQGVGY